MDVVSPQVRSRMMSGIGGKNTKPEIALRKALHARGLRFRLHDKRLPGRPDMVLPRWQTVVFVNGCFWHRHAGCRFATTPGTRPEFWEKKFAANVLRDLRNAELLTGAGWRVVVAWECEIRQDVEVVAEKIEDVIRSGHWQRSEDARPRPSDEGSVRWGRRWRPHRPGSSPVTGRS